MRGRERIALATAVAHAALIAPMAVAVACGDGSFGGDRLLVRVENATALDFEEVRIWPGPDRRLIFPDVGAGATTRYVELREAFRIASVRALTSSDTFALQVIDYVGEEPLDPGRYTYVLENPDPETRFIGQRLRKDR